MYLKEYVILNLFYPVKHTIQTSKLVYHIRMFFKNKRSSLIYDFSYTKKTVFFHK